MNHWPSVVVEVDFSDSPSMRISDAQFWLSGSNSNKVKIVITTRIGRISPEIVLEKWELMDDRAERQQVVAVSKGQHNRVYKGEPLIIDFDKLFLRLMDDPREKDIPLCKAILEEFASEIWEE
ncbi:hypothetical protein N7492_004376 [Penicillium capsulatum]|uniref:Uncharacterized protein n=1 Tax=Penicillium capsulatum TaxID=69766 RepID=A0A9W9I9W0_9EURO|nr:hypothetical protein N7492_004376 [Penicillium capsulatum]